MKSHPKKRIAVIGAGIAGLICAYELQKAGFSVVVYEKEKHVGGRMSTRTKKDFPFDIGADHLANVYTEMRKYANELNLSWEKMNFLQYGLLKNGRIIPANQGVGFLSKMLLSLQFLQCGKGIDFFDLSTGAKYDTDNAYNCMKKKTGKEIADYYVDPFTSAYQFHRSQDISASALRAIMQSLKYHKADWALHKTKGGMSALPNALAKHLQVKTAKAVTEIRAKEECVEIITKEKNGKKKTEAFDRVVIATTASIAKKIYVNPTTAQENVLDATKYATTISVAFRVPTKKFHNYSIVWAPYVESKAIASFGNEMMKGEEVIHKDKSLLSVWLHEDFAKKIIDRSDTEIFSIVKNEFLKLCSWFSNDELEYYDLQRWPEAMPKFSHGYITQVSEFLKKGQGENNVYLCGDYLNSPWTEGAVRCGQRVAKKIIASY